MSDLKLVPPEQPTPFEQQLLDAVAKEAPSAEQRARVRLALGLPAIAPSVTTMAPVGRRALLLKAGGGLVVVAGAMLALFFAVGRKPNSPDKQAAAPIATQQAAAPVVATAEPAPAPSPALPATEPAPSAAPTNAREDSAPTRRASKAAPADSAADLSDQLRLIDAARAAVAAGNASAASAALTSYRTRFPRGPFGQEAAVLQIETLDLQGNHAQAAAQARSFLARYPNSPHASVVRRIAGR
ncbi:MAG TPA: outer membrane protein assembly factor BamD [Polyangiaceae bacterium]|nr:outer membrane protein assembly factor BamD [Polyangiaceae bacterium]